MNHQVSKSLFLLFLMWGCGATEYQPKGFKGGYEDAHIKDNLYFVEFQSNAYTDQLTTERYFLRRAKEICEENGYKDFRIKGEKDITLSHGIMAGTMVTFVPKPGSAGYVECLDSKKTEGRKWQKQ